MLGETHNNLVLAPDLRIKTNNNHAEVWKCFYNSIFWQHVQIGSQLLKVATTCVSRHCDTSCNYFSYYNIMAVITNQFKPVNLIGRKLNPWQTHLYTRKQTRNLILHDGRGSGVVGLIEHSKTLIMKTTNGKSGITNPLFSTRSLQHRLTTCN